MVLPLLREHQRPADVLRQLDRISGDPLAFADYELNYWKIVFQEVANYRPGVPASYLESKTRALLRDFVEDFRTRPLRKLTWDEACHFPTAGAIPSLVVAGLGSNTKLDVANGGSRTFLMTNNQILSIATYTKNSCGVLPANDYAYQLKNGALIPIVLP